jgi:hypothetical protein
MDTAAILVEVAPNREPQPFIADIEQPVVLAVLPLDHHAARELGAPLTTPLVFCRCFLRLLNR